MRVKSSGNVERPTSLAYLLTFFLVVLVRFAVTGWDSIITGSISGRFIDPSGDVVPSAQVTAVDTATGVRHTTRTDASGFYSFPDLLIGTYEVQVRHQGFKLFRVSKLVINANTALRVDATLQIGATTERVTVTSAALHMETTSTQMGDVNTGTQMTAIPLNGRGYTDLLALHPGVVPVQTGEFTVAASGATLTPSGNLNSGNLSISGGREGANGFMVNGGNVEAPGSNGTEVIPDLDAVGEQQRPGGLADGSLTRRLKG